MKSANVALHFGLRVIRHGASEQFSNLDIFVEFEYDENGDKRLDDHHQHGQKERIHDQHVDARDGCGQIEHERARVRQNWENSEIGDDESGLAERVSSFLAQPSPCRNIYHSWDRLLFTRRHEPSWWRCCCCWTCANEQLFGEELPKRDNENGTQRDLSSECEKVAAQKGS